MAYQLTSEQYARIYGCTGRSVRNYERDAAPLDDPEDMYHWLWKRRTQPAGFTGKSIEDLLRAYARVAGNAEEREAILCDEISDTLFEMDVRQLIIRWQTPSGGERRLPAEVRGPGFCFPERDPQANRRVV